MNFNTAAGLLELCEKHGISISEAMVRRETEVLGGDQEEIFARMARSYEIMKDGVRRSLNEPLRSMGGLIGGEAQKLSARRAAGETVCGDTMSRAITYAMGMLEVNASMGVIVAAPTAGSCGVIPGVFLAVQEERGLEDAPMVDALFHTAAVGYLIAHNATIAGAEGGCQAEVGSASAMAASAVVYLMGGSPAQSLGAASTALCNIMGLVCDPVGGLVEAPCQNRNAMGAANALVSAEIALAGISALIPFDEAVEAMYRVGTSLPRELRETALGGMAATPTACRLCHGGGSA